MAVGVAVLATLTLVLLAVTRVSDPPVDARAYPRPTADESRLSSAPGAAQIQVGVIGGSYTFDKPHGWPRLMLDQVRSDTFDLQLRVSYNPGSGYADRADGGATFGKGVAQVVQPTTDILMVVGSRNDRYEVDQIDRPARDLVQQARTISPDIHIVMVGPLWSNTAPPEDVYRVRDVLSAVAADLDTDFVDPLELRWFFEGDGLIGEDGVHPTHAGQLYLAERLAPVLAPIVDEVVSNLR